MSIGLAIFLVVAAIGIGWLYWSEHKKCCAYEKLIVEGDERVVLPLGTGIFVREAMPEVEKDIADVVSKLSSQGIEVSYRRTHKWGMEVGFGNGYRVYICNPDIAIPTLEISTAFVGEDLSADQVLRITTQHSNTLIEIHLYESKKV